jgi:phosphoglycerol transferase MdoB-like AlkP superfamily enzyme
MKPQDHQPTQQTTWYSSILSMLLISLILTVASLLFRFGLNEAAFWSQLSSRGFWLEWLLLSLLLLLLYRLSERAIFSALLLGVVYALFNLANNEKIAELEIPLVPADLRYFQQLLFLDHSNTSSVQWLAWLLITAGLLLIILWFRERPGKLRRARRLRLLLVLMLGLFSWPWYQPMIAQWAHSQDRKLSRPNLLAESRQLGLLSFMLKKALISQTSPPPEGYSRSKIHELLSQQPLAAFQQPPETQPNVIVFFIEAFTDPMGHNYEFYHSPTPFFNALAANFPSGQVLSPVVGGRSANAEFELLTGMSMRYLPAGSIPFIDLGHRPMFSLASVLKDRGYETTALHVASLSFFNYQEVYPNMGFTAVETIHGQAGVVKDLANRYPNEASLVDAIIAKTRRPKPQFIHAFPNATHGPYDYPLPADLPRLADTGRPAEEDDKLNVYLQALRQADLAIEKLIRYYMASSEPTLILIVGDHLPGYIPYRLDRLAADFSRSFPAHEVRQITQLPSRKAQLKAFQQLDPVLYHFSMHATPYVLWSNTGFQDPGDYDTSMNLLHLRLLNELGSNEPWFNLTRSLHQSYRFFSDLTGGQDNLSFTNTGGSLGQDYELLQYDVLFGENHYQQWIRRQREQ